MSRLVRIPKFETADRPSARLDDLLSPGFDVEDRRTPPAQPADNYLERIAKYIPGEVLAFFIFINVILEQAMKAGGKAAAMAGIPVFFVAVGALSVSTALVPVFVWYVREPGDAWRTNAWVSTLAFPFWAYAVGAVAFDDYWDGNLAAILLATFTVVSGLASPRAPRPIVREKKQLAPVRTERPHLDLVEPSPT
jgi:hypothetical protein